jgi:type VI secretion system secreted protein VgrG
MSILELSFANGETSLEVRRFSVHETVSAPFACAVWARSKHADIDLEALVGKDAGLRIQSGMAFSTHAVRTWTGVCSHIEQVQAESTGLSTYYLRIVPRLWLLNQRRGHRIFQRMTIPEIVKKVLAEWGITPELRLDLGRYPKLDYKVQYGESDFDLVSRLLEEASIAYVFEDDGGESQLVLADALEKGEARGGPPLPSVDNPNQSAEQEFVTRVRLSHEVRPGAHVIRDHDFRRPTYPLFGDAPKAPAPEDRYEQYEYRPGAFLIESGGGGDTPVADDKGVYRHDQPFGKGRAARMLDGERAGKRAVALDTNVLDLRPGRVFRVGNHPHPELGEARRLLSVESSLEGSPDGEWISSALAFFCDAPYRPPLRTKKPEVSGVQSATVVGPPGEEIWVDEFGRVRVQFPWDREGKMDDNASCWMRVSQGWAGTGYGLLNLPRVGQEVLVGFLDGDPDQPIVVGRVFNAVQQVPYKLPFYKTRSTWKSDSSPGSGGFNEIMFEDLKSQELIWMQAQKNLKKLVKNDESMTIGRNRQKLALHDELETTGGNRVEITAANRTEITLGKRLTVIHRNEEKLVKGSEVERTIGDVKVMIGGDQDVVVKRTRRERVEGDAHLVVHGRRAQRIDGKQSLSVGGDRHELTGGSHLIAAGRVVHVRAGSALVIEAEDITLKAPGGFVRIDGGGVTIQGTVVKINSGGSANSAPDPQPDKPAEAILARIDEPAIPEPENLLITGIGQ